MGNTKIRENRVNVFLEELDKEEKYRSETNRKVGQGMIWGWEQ